jgi:hypothetical protein
MQLTLFVAIKPIVSNDPMLNAVKLNVNMLNAIMLPTIMLNAIKLNVNMANAIY